MSQDSNPLGLYIPEQTIEFADAPYIKPRDAEKWISNLPTAHVGETARLVYKAMSEINRVPLPALQRFKLLELFREPFAYVNQALQKHYINLAFPLSNKNQKIAELTQELQQELAIGYKIIIEASLSQRSGRIDNKTLLTSIYRAISYLGDAILKSYLTYAPTNGQTWLEIHHLYLFSEHNSLITESVKDELNFKSEISTGTIGSLYKQIILLSLANPYRLAQTEILRVNKALQEWSKYSHLHILDNPNNPIGLFSIDLENDAPPSYYHTGDEQANTSFVRILDTSELTRILRDQYENNANKEQEQEKNLLQNRIDPSDISNETSRRLILAWGAVPKRNFSRKGKEERIDVTLGLSATHCYIKKQYESAQQEKLPLGESFSDSQIEFQQRSHYDSEFVEQLGEPSSKPDVWDLASNPNLASRDEFNFTPFSNTEEQQPTPEPIKPFEKIYDIFNCLLINESAGGYCISWDNSSKTKTIVGSLIGIKNRNEDEDSDWSIGVIRWLKSPSKTPMYIGIELLSPSAQAIASKNLSTNNEFTRALLLPELLTVKQPQTLITQSLYKVGENLELDVHGQSISIKLRNLITSSSAFNQFEFSIIKTENKVEQSIENEKLKNFDSIWSSI